MYEVSSIKWINLKAKPNKITKNAAFRSYTTNSVALLDQNHQHCLKRKTQSCQLETSPSKPKIKLQLKSKMLDYFMNNLKEHFKRKIKEKSSTNNKSEEQFQQKAKRSSSANRYSLIGQKPTFELIDIRKKQIVESSMPTFENKKLLVLKKSRHHTREHSRNKSYYNQSQHRVVTMYEQASTLQHNENDTIAENQGSYLRTQFKKRIHSSQNYTSDYEQAGKKYCEQSYIIPQHQKTQKPNQKIYLRSAFNDLKVNKIDFKPSKEGCQREERKEARSWSKMSVGAKRHTLNSRKRAQLQRNKQKSIAEDLKTILSLHKK